MSGFNLDGYVEVKDRIAMFWEKYPDGRINCRPPEVVAIGDRLFISSYVEVWTVGATDNRDDPTTTGSAWEPYPGRTPYTKDSEAMNAETSAIGRALGALGIGVGGSMASATEVRNRQADRATPDSEPQGCTNTEAFEALRSQMTAQGIDDPDGEQAKTIWKTIAPKAVNGLIPDDELERLLAGIGTEPFEEAS